MPNKIITEFYCKVCNRTVDNHIIHWSIVHPRYYLEQVIELRKVERFFEVPNEILAPREDDIAMVKEFIDTHGGYALKYQWNNSYHDSDSWLFLVQGNATDATLYPLYKREFVKREGSRMELERIRRWEMSRKAGPFQG